VLGKINNRTYSVHRLGYTLLVGPIPPGKCVLHHCDNPPCWEPEHLFTGTKRLNNLDRDSKRRNFRVLADDEVRAVRARLTGRYGNQTALAAEYGVALQTINAIARNRSWRGLK